MGPENVDAINILNAVTPKGDVQATTVEDVQNYTPQDLSPEQKQAFTSQYQPVTGPLSSNTYYPDLGHNIGVGSYGGSEIGSTTLFAPGGGLVPLGLLDARDLAVQKAAMQKAKDLEDFNKKIQAPTTKHTAVQKALTDSYFEGLNKWMGAAKKKSGGNQALANKMLQNDPNFSAWNKGMQDRAKLHDQGVEIAANLDVMEKDPNMVLSPATRAAKKAFMSGEMYAGQDPFNKQGTQYTKNFLAMQAAADLDVSTNKELDKAIPDIEQMTPEQIKAAGFEQFIGRGKHEIASFFEKEYFKPERVKDMAHNLYMSQYQGTGFTEKDVLENLQSKIGEKVRRKTEGYDKYFKPDSSGAQETDYSKVAPTSNTSFNITAKTGTGNAIKEIFSQSSYKTSAQDEGKKITVTAGPNTIDVKGKKIHEKAGALKGTVSQIFTGYYDQARKRWLSPKEVESFKSGGMGSAHDIIAKPAVMFNIEKDAGEKGEGNALILDVNDVKGKFPGKGKAMGLDGLIEKVEVETETENSKRKGTGWDYGTKTGQKTGAKSEATKTNNTESLRKKYNY